ncbi:MAG: class II aldolase/adducin family protein [Holophagaceae bacterium]|nr:class II aldolase/adducin family protein [Holophagaceae bacterium]
MNKQVFPDDHMAKQSIVEVGRRMYEKKFVAASDGNISCKVSEDVIWTTPTGVSKGFMLEETLIKMRLDGTILSAGAMEPSSEIKMHICIYNENPSICGITHAHPPVSTSFAIAGIALDMATYSEAVVNLGAIPCVHYETPGSQGLADSVAPYCRDYNGLLLANHGVLTWGRSLMEALFRLESLEHFALIHMYTSRLIGKTNVLSKDQVEELLANSNRLGIVAGGALRSASVPSNLLDIGGKK